MKFSITHAFLLAIWTCLLFSCSKNAGTLPPENSVEEDTVSYPVLMFLAPERKGLARLFSNGKEIQNPQYAASFVAEADLFYFKYSEPPRKIQFESKDSVGIFFTSQPAMFGIHKDDTTFLLQNRYPFATPDDVGIDTGMIYYTVNPSSGFYHTTITAYGDLKEFRMPVFSYSRARYTVQPNGDTTISLVNTSFKFSAFKESYINTLGPLDTLGIQEYELVYRPR
jgi:hypothetical protein